MRESMNDQFRDVIDGWIDGWMGRWIYRPINPSIGRWTNSFILSFVRSFINSFIHNFIHSLISLSIKRFFHLQTIMLTSTGLWAVVNNAGILGAIGSTYLHTRQDYENTLAVNLYGVIMVTKACMPLVLKEKGRIVNTSSVAGRIAFVNSSYTVSKYAVEAFSDVLR